MSCRAVSVGERGVNKAPPHVVELSLLSSAINNHTDICSVPQLPSADPRCVPRLPPRLISSVRALGCGEACMHERQLASLSGFVFFVGGVFCHQKRQRSSVAQQFFLFFFKKVRSAGRHVNTTTSNMYRTPCSVCCVDGACQPRAGAQRREFPRACMGCASLHALWRRTQRQLRAAAGRS
jgi:hypothetical protein